MYKEIGMIIYNADTRRMKILYAEPQPLVKCGHKNQMGTVSLEVMYRKIPLKAL